VSIRASLSWWQYLIVFNVPVKELVSCIGVHSRLVLFFASFVLLIGMVPLSITPSPVRQATPVIITVEKLVNIASQSQVDRR
jgi:hypothetical protein